MNIKKKLGEFVLCPYTKIYRVFVRCQYLYREQVRKLSSIQEDLYVAATFNLSKAQNPERSLELVRSERELYRRKRECPTFLPRETKKAEDRTSTSLWGLTTMYCNRLSETSMSSMIHASWFKHKDCSPLCLMEALTS